MSLSEYRRKRSFGKTYSLRGRTGAPVAMPIAWSELSTLTRADAFTMKDVPVKLKRRRKDPWADINAIQQNLARWAQDDGSWER